MEKKKLKTLTPKQILQRLLIAFAQVKASNTSKNLLNEIEQIIYSLHRSKEIAKKVNSNIMNLIKVQDKMDTVFMNSKNSKISDPHKLLLKLSVKIVLKRSDKSVALSNFSIYYTKIYGTKKSYRNNKQKISAATLNEKFE